MCCIFVCFSIVYALKIRSNLFVSKNILDLDMASCRICFEIYLFDHSLYTYNLQFYRDICGKIIFIC
jgi:hypothetical protein